MSLSNPERIVTKQDLKDFYDGILPYLGGNVEAGFTPIGTIIAVMGNSAPTNYLACNGQVVNIADYPELANYFLAQFGSRNKFGGDGTTTFGIPDLRGEFLRGTGTNSHTNQGSGSDVGTHQDATKIPYFGKESGYTNSQARLFAATKNDRNFPTNMDYQTKKSDNSQSYWYTTGTATDESGYNYPYIFTPRPTNTSVLYCIATKNIYLNPSLSYTEEEQVVGQWVSGEPLYQKTIHFSSPIPLESNTWVNTGVSVSSMKIDKLVYSEAIDTTATSGHYIPFNVRVTEIVAAGTISVLQTRNATQNLGLLTLRYTKTTD